MSECFYGWYFRCQSAGESLAVIPAVHVSNGRSSCSVQVLTQSGSFYREFPIAQFRVNREKMVMQIGENLFSRKGIRLRLEAERKVRFFPDGECAGEKKEGQGSRSVSDKIALSFWCL